MDNQEPFCDTVATVAVTPSTPEEMAIVHALKSGDTSVVILSLFVMMIGKTGWGFWSDWRKQKHEEKMRKMELDAKIKLAKIGESREDE